MKVFESAVFTGIQRLSFYLIAIFHHVLNCYINILSTAKRYLSQQISEIKETVRIVPCKNYLTAEENAFSFSPALISRLINFIVFLLVTVLNNNLKEFEPVLDNTGKITGYKTSVGGADTTLKKLGSGELVEVSLPYTADGDYPVVAFVVPFVPTDHGLAQPSGGYGEIMDVTANRIVVRGSKFVGNINLPSTSISPAVAITYVEKGHRYTVKNSATANAQIYTYLYILK